MTYPYPTASRATQPPALVPGYAGTDAADAAEQAEVDTAWEGLEGEFALLCDVFERRGRDDDERRTR